MNIYSQAEHYLPGFRLFKFQAAAINKGGLVRAATDQMKYSIRDTVIPDGGKTVTTS